MGKYTGYLMATDLDGTLLTHDKNISKENKEAIKNFTQNGGIFTIATGRSIESTRPYAKAIAINAPVVLLNGLMLYDYENEQTIWENFLPSTVKALLSRVLAVFDTLSAEVYVGREHYVIRDNVHMQDHIKIEFSTPIYAQLDDIPPDNWYKILLIDEQSIIDDVIEHCKTENAEEVTFMRSTKTYYEILPKGVDKGNAFTALCERLGIPLEKSLAIGDYYNDTGLIKAAGVGAVTGNAPDDLKAIADLVTVSCEDSAIADFVSRF